MISSYPNSFFQLQNPVNFNCVEPIEVCLPVLTNSDLYGWALYTDEEVSESERGEYNFYFRLVKDCSQSVANFEPSTGVRFTPVKESKEGGNTILLPPKVKPDGTPYNYGVDFLQCGECFFIQVIRVYHPFESTVYEKEIVGCIGCFQKICDPCYTSVIQYYNKENAFGFVYTTGVPNLLTGFFNRIRLPMYFKQPQFPQTRNVFTLSNGNKKKLSARIEKEWNLETDYMPKEWHERLVIALEHDFIGAQNVNSNITTELMNESNYEIEWQDFLDYPLGKGKCKLKQIPYKNYNSNCK